MANKDFNCSSCLSRYDNRTDGVELTARLRKLKGCESKMDKPIHHINREIKFSRCIGNFFDQPSVFLVEAHRNYERGVLPFAGSLMDQPNKVMESFNVISAWNHERQLEAQEQSKRAQRTRG